MFSAPFHAGGQCCFFPWSHHPVLPSRASGTPGGSPVSISSLQEPRGWGCSSPSRAAPSPGADGVLLWPPLPGRPTLPQRMPSPTGTLRCWPGTSPQPGGVRLTKALDLFFRYYGQYIKGIYLRKCLSCQSFPMSPILNTPYYYWYYPGKYSPWSFLHWEPWLYLSASPHYNYHQAIFIAILLLFMIFYALQKSICSNFSFRDRFWLGHPLLLCTCSCSTCTDQSPGTTARSPGTEGSAGPGKISAQHTWTSHRNFFHSFLFLAGAHFRTSGVSG